VDATGAGDSFASAFVGRFIGKAKDNFTDQYLISEALKAGIINSTSVVNKLGAEEGLLSKSGIDEGLVNNPRMVVEVT
jgi:sugar/nucleoside kinase (ribokinase family)